MAVQGPAAYASITPCREGGCLISDLGCHIALLRRGPPRPDRWYDLESCPRTQFCTRVELRALRSDVVMKYQHESRPCLDRSGIAPVLPERTQPRMPEMVLPSYPVVRGGVDRLSRGASKWLAAAALAGKVRPELRVCVTEHVREWESIADGGRHPGRLTAINCRPPCSTLG